MLSYIVTANTTKLVAVNLNEEFVLNPQHTIFGPVKIRNQHFSIKGSTFVKILS